MFCWYGGGGVGGARLRRSLLQLSSLDFVAVLVLSYGGGGSSLRCSSLPAGLPEPTHLSLKMDFCHMDYNNMVSNLNVPLDQEGRNYGPRAIWARVLIKVDQVGDS